MLVTFKTDVYANITMFGNDALAMLKMMGHSGTIPSAILAEDVPVALERLVTAIDAQKATQPIQDKEGDAPTVSLVNRALPLIELLTAAAKAHCNVMWE